MYHGTAEQGYLRSRIFCFYQLHKLNIVGNEGCTVKRQSWLFTIAPTKIVRAQRNAYYFRCVWCKVPTLPAFLLEISFLIHLRHSRAIAIPIAINANTAYAAHDIIHVQCPGYA